MFTSTSFAKSTNFVTPATPVTSTNNDFSAPLIFTVLPMELNIELLCHFNPQFIINELMRLASFRSLRNYKSFRLKFCKRYICSRQEEDIPYDVILRLYCNENREGSSAISMITKFFKNLTNSPDAILHENLKQAAVHNWDTYLEFLDRDDERFEKMKYVSIIIEAAYYNSIEFLRKLMSDYYYHSNGRYEPWYSIFAGVTVAILRGHKYIYDILTEYLIGTTFTIKIGKMLNDIVPRFVNAELRDGLNLDDNDYLSVVSLFSYAIIKDRALEQVYNLHTIQFGAVLTNKLLLTHLRKNHIEWLINDHGINCKRDIMFLLSIGMDRKFLTEEQLMLFEV